MSLLEPAESSVILDADPALVEFLQGPDGCLSEVIGRVLSSYSGRDALAWRPSRDGVLSPSYVKMSYDDLRRRVYAVASTLAHHPAFRMKAQDAVAIMAFANVDFVTLNLALGLNGIIVAPLQTSASDETLTSLVTELSPPCIATSFDHLEAVVGFALASPETRSILVFDYDGIDAAADAALTAARARLAKEKPGCVLMTFSEAIRQGEDLPPIQPFVPQADENPIGFIYYTSGSTGTPKGAMAPERLVRRYYGMVRPKSPTVLHYQPLNHAFGTAYVALALTSGGTTYFTGRTDLSTLLEDLAVVRPTSMGLVPRVCELLYERFLSGLREGESRDAAIERFRMETVGGRLVDAITGTAPMSDDLHDFIARITQGGAVDHYGASETGSVTINGIIQRPPVIDYKLLDVPELGYFTTDKPYPRGELILRTNALFMGYFKRPDLTAQAVDSDGYYHTGDVMAQVGPDHLRYVDRRNNVIKLAQGEFVPIAQLEALYSAGASGVGQIYLYGNSNRSYLLGVVVPDRAALPPGADEAQIKTLILDAIKQVAAEQGRHTYEIPRDIILEPEPFSTENGLLSGVGKHLRPAFRDRYDARLEAIYDTFANEQQRELADLTRNGRDAPVLATICRAAAAVLGLDQVGADDSASFADLGGDSLAALSYALLLEDIYGFPVDVGTIMHPSGSFGQLAAEIETALANDSQDPCTVVHGADTGVLRASDLTIAKLVSPAVLRDAASLQPPKDTEPKVVLLTGANGFLGRFLCLEWLKRLEKTGGRLICIGRGADDAAAERRLLDVFAGGDGALDRDVRALAAGGRLTVLAGDLSAPRLGLSDERWAQLAQEVDLIVHPAALVNHKLPYRQLFRPNVYGTAQLIELALTARMKRIAHVSTIAAAAHGGVIASEDDDLPAVLPEWRTGDGYADGYAASKWAAEILLADASARHGLPVSVFRSNMILAPVSYSGQINVPDMFTRQILSLALTRIAPQSFYAGGEGRPHYEGLPADFLAAAVVAIGEARRSGHHVFHVLNPHDDGISMDTFVDWLGDLGYGCARIASFDDWRARFETALRALPEERRQASMLPLMEALAQPQRACPGASIPAPRFTEAVAQSHATESGEIPHLGPELIARYVEELKAEGLL